jgi:hypothetical protein
VTARCRISKQILRAQEIKARFGKWDFIQLKSFYKVKETITRMKRWISQEEEIFANSSSDNGLIPRIYKELKKLTPKGQII